MRQIEGAQNKPGIYRGIMRWEYVWSIAYTMYYTAQGLHTAHSIGGSTHITHTIHTLYTRYTQHTQRHTYTCIAKVGTHKYTHLC